MANLRTKFVTFVLIITLLVNATHSANDHRHLRSVLGAFFDSNRPSAATIDHRPPSTTCTTGCSKKYTIVESSEPQENVMTENEPYSVTEQELTALRIEYIKNQILKKLRLKEPPQASISHLPQPVTDNNFILPKKQVDINDILYNHYSDDFYGKTTQAIIFPYEDEAKCGLRKIRNPSACIPFQMPSDIAASDVSSVELWFYKEADILDTHNQTFVISEVAHWDTNKSFQKNKPIAIQETDLSKGWIRVDVAYVIKNWLLYQDSPTHAINVACKTCGMDIYKSPISFKQSLKPFLVIHTYSQPQQLPAPRRPKRHVNCVPGANECCRESLYVSFAEIGWDDWIIQPAGYNAYFCKGSCRTAASLTLLENDYNSILHKVMYGSNRSKTQRLELTPCCAATKFDKLELLYTSNKTISKKVLPDMIVNSCGCM